jgi:uncharacterized protein
MELTVIKLPKENNYAIVVPGQITYALNATRIELEQVKEDVLKKYEKLIIKKDKSKCSMAIIPTFDCNLKCIYCYAKGGDSKEVISLNKVKKAINYVRNMNKLAECFDLYLVGGGEPLLYFDLILKIVNYAESKFNNVKIHVVTNGTFSEKILNWLIEKDVNVRISFDGFGHDIQRKFQDKRLSSTVVKENIKKLVQRGNEPIVQCIVTSTSINHMIDTIDMVADLGIKVIKFEPALITDISRGEKTLEPNPVNYAYKLIEVIEYIEKKKIPLLVDTGFFSKPTDGNYCGISGDNFVLTPEGMITSCVEVSKVNDPYSDKIMIGEIKEEKININEDNKEFLEKLNYKNQIGGCAACDLRLICIGGCPMANIWQSGLPLKKSNFTCKVEHAFLPTILLKIAENPKIMEILMENVDRQYN